MKVAHLIKLLVFLKLTMICADEKSWHLLLLPSNCYAMMRAWVCISAWNSSEAHTFPEQRFPFKSYAARCGCFLSLERLFSAYYVGTSPRHSILSRLFSNSKNSGLILWNQGHCHPAIHFLQLMNLLQGLSHSLPCSKHFFLEASKSSLGFQCYFPLPRHNE